MEAVKGECYMNAYHALIERQFESGWKIVHGVCIGRGPIAGVQFGHAWLEQTIPLSGGVFAVVMAYDPSADVTLTAEYYRQLGQVQYAVEYTQDEYYKLMIEAGHYGPFDPTVAAAKHG